MKSEIVMWSLSAADLDTAEGDPLATLRAQSSLAQPMAHSGGRTLEYEKTVAELPFGVDDGYGNRWTWPTFTAFIDDLKRYESERAKLAAAADECGMWRARAERAEAELARRPGRR